MTFAQLLLDARPRRITQQEAADKIGVSDSAISTWERGMRVPGVDDFARLMDLYGVDDAGRIKLLAAARRVAK